MSDRLDEPETLLGRKMTLEEWADLPDDEEGELVDGILVAEEQVTVTHGVVRIILGRFLEEWACSRGVFVGGDDTFKLRVTARRGRKPDMFVYLRGQPRPPREATLVVRPPSIVVEIVSKSRGDVRRDRIDKMIDYAKAKVPWYWLVDPQLRLLEIFELGPDARYAFAAGAGDGKLDPVPGCEGLALDLDALWARLEEF
jgi:Uma2 family endonuclease